MPTVLAATIVSCLSLSAVDGARSSATARTCGSWARQAFESGVDAPEISRAKCQKERILGQQAKRHLEELLRQPGTQIEDSGARDRYGRPLVWGRLRNGSTAGAVLLSEGYAVPWYPGRSVDWCS